MENWWGLRPIWLEDVGLENAMGSGFEGSDLRRNSHGSTEQR